MIDLQTHADEGRVKSTTRLVMVSAILLCVALLTSFTTAQAGEPPAPALDPAFDIPHYQPTSTIVILGAVPQEVPTLVALLQDRQEGIAWGIPYWQGKLHGKPVVIAITGIGKTFTAMTTTLFLTQFRPRLVVMTGTGARINPELRTGDVIVANRTLEHDYGSLTGNDMVYRPLNSPVAGAEIENGFVPPEQLLGLAKQALAEYPGSTVTADGNTYQTRQRFGVVASSDLFGVTQARIDLLREQFSTDIMEMESAPLGLVCQFFQVPYLIVRSGSNIAQEAPNDDYLRLGPIAAREAAAFTAHLIRYL